jgi:hypothetical protein
MSGVAPGATARPPAPGLLGLLVAAVTLMALCAMTASLARGDGDPASDFLLEQSTFLSPFDGHVSSAAADSLVQMLSQASKRGLPLKVAVIVTAYDLGAVPVLFRMPETYAKFLGEEDYYYWKDELLVVMPNGYGLYKSSGLPAADVALIHRLAFQDTANGTTLVLDAERAVRALAARRGIELAATSAGATGSSTGKDRVEIAVAVAAAFLLAVGARFGWRKWSPR